MVKRTGQIPLSALYRGTSLMRKRPPPKGHLRALGIAILQGPTGRRFLMGEVPLCVIVLSSRTLSARALSCEWATPIP